VAKQVKRGRSHANLLGGAPGFRTELVLVYEPEEACRVRLLAAGHAPGRAYEISSYLAQSTDLVVEFDAIKEACAARDLVFTPVELDKMASCFDALREGALVWTLTDGFAYFRGGIAPALARLRGLRTIGSDDTLFALCQDKFRSGAVLRALGLPVPEAGLARGGEWLVRPPVSVRGHFVKPNLLGAKIGIWDDSCVATEAEALALSRRIFAAYGDDAIVQSYIPGRNVRASFLAVRRNAGPDAIGVCFVDSGGDFQTMADSLALYGETGMAARAEGRYIEPELVAVADLQPEADRAIRAIAGRLMKALGLRDVFSLDLRVEENGAVHLIEFEVCPGLPCFDFRAYCRRQWGMSLAEAMAETAASRLCETI
jgi:D-alanine-D-alanine ligase